MTRHLRPGMQVREGRVDRQRLQRGGLAGGQQALRVRAVDSLRLRGGRLPRREQAAEAVPDPIHCEELLPLLESILEPRTKDAETAANGASGGEEPVGHETAIRGRVLNGDSRNG